MDALGLVISYGGSIFTLSLKSNPLQFLEGSQGILRGSPGEREGQKGVCQSDENLIHSQRLR